MSVYKELKTEPHLTTNRELLKEKLYRDTMLINYLTVSKSFIKERSDQKTLCYQDNDDDVEC
jgi:hypothetical protein